MELFLIAHKVRGKLAFDVAEKMVCPVCQGEKRHTISGSDSADDDDISCSNCESTGHWWILSTVGHRAYPFLTFELAKLYERAERCGEDRMNISYMPIYEIDIPLPPNLRDFYSIHDRQVKAKPQAGPNDNLTLEDLGL